VNLVLTKRMGKYVAGGLGTAFFEFGMFVLLDFYTNLGPNEAHTISYLSAILVNFAFLKFWIFSDSQNTYVREFTGYMIAITVNLTLSNIIILLLSNHINEILAKIITMAMVVFWNYFLMNKYIFYRKN
jgi:putative flippase GtrA